MVPAQSWSRIWYMMIAVFLSASVSGGSAGAKTIGLQPVVSGLSSPVGLVNAGDGSNRLFIIDQAGVIRIFNGAQLLATPFLNITTKVLSGGERGLLGLAFDSSYASNGLFYVYYTSQPAGDITIARYSVSADPNVANAGSEVILKTQAHPTFANHNGGSLLFGPDGCLYAGIGDGGSGGVNSQDLSTLLGKIIRISPLDGSACTAAPGNPFVGTMGARPEIWALGLRNPWRITFDRQTQEIFIADVGESSREEVDVQPPSTGGLNFCWRRKEGTAIFDSSTACTIGTPTDPVLEYTHTGGNCAITGGYRYRGNANPNMVGTYFYGDLCTGIIWGATESGGAWSTAQLIDTTLTISTFGEDEAGEIYVVHLASSTGAIYRITSAAPHDFSGEGKSDIAWRQNAGAVAVWLMNGATLSQGAGFGTVPTSWSVVGQRDFNGDGKHDLLWRDTSGNVAIWFMNGASLASSAGLGSVPTAWSIAGTGDFNGDSKGDLLWRDSSGNVAIWLMNGSSISQTAGLGAVSNSWAIVGTGDFDGDGKTDILWRNTSTGDIAIWFMNGASLASSAVLGNVPTAWSIVGTGDFNADGKADILWRDSSGNVAIWLMNGASIVQGAGLGNVPTSWIIAETGDYSGDGKADLLWRNTSTGDVAMWFMNGVQLSSGMGLGIIGTDWSIQGFNVD